jgi:hypothetical protein
MVIPCDCVQRPANLDTWLAPREVNAICVVLEASVNVPSGRVSGFCCYCRGTREKMTGTKTRWGGQLVWWCAWRDAEGAGDFARFLHTSRSLAMWLKIAAALIVSFW